jgi:hypothetical protein
LFRAMYIGRCILELFRAMYIGRCILELLRAMYIGRCILELTTAERRVLLQPFPSRAKIADVIKHRGRYVPCAARISSPQTYIAAVGPPLAALRSIEWVNPAVIVEQAFSGASQVSKELRVSCGSRPSVVTGFMVSDVNTLLQVQNLQCCRAHGLEQASAVS